MGSECRANYNIPPPSATGPPPSPSSSALAVRPLAGSPRRWCSATTAGGTARTRSGSARPTWRGTSDSGPSRSSARGSTILTTRTYSRAAAGWSTLSTTPGRVSLSFSVSGKMFFLGGPCIAATVPGPAAAAVVFYTLLLLVLLFLLLLLLLQAATSAPTVLVLMLLWLLALLFQLL